MTFNEELDIEELKRDIAPALTDVIANQLKEACKVSLQFNNHNIGVHFSLEGQNTKSYSLIWDYCHDERIFDKYDIDNASEWGAYCLAILLICKLTPLTAYKRSYKGTGFDYYLCEKNQTSNSMLFKNCSGRLEVSGIGKGTSKEVNSRVKIKLNQVTRSDDMKIPAYIIVVEFGTPCSKMVVKNGKN